MDFIHKEIIIMKVEKCKNCSYYTAYYTQCSSFYSRTSKGFCRKNNQQQKELDTCENFKDNGKITAMREERLFEALEWSLKSINDIAQILKEKADKKNPIS